MRIEHLDVILTYTCNSVCRHCLITPQLRNSETMSPEFSRELIESMSKEFPVNSILIFGGEPLLEMQPLLSVLSAAKHQNISQTTVVSNGNPLHPHPLPSSGIFEKESLHFSTESLLFFRNRIHSDEKNRLKQIAQQLSETKMGTLEISLDIFHQEYLDPEEAIQLAENIKNIGASNVIFAPRFLDAKCMNNYLDGITLRMLDYIKEHGFEIKQGEQINPRGNAVRYLSNYLTPLHSKTQFICPNSHITAHPDDSHNICISPLGEIIFCDNFIVGGGSVENIVKDLQNLNHHKLPELSTIIETGVQGLLHSAESKNFTYKDQPIYSVCDLCVKSRKHLELGKICDI